MSEEILETEILLIFLHQKTANSILSTQKHRRPRREGTSGDLQVQPLSKQGPKGIRLLRVISSCILNYLQKQTSLLSDSVFWSPSQDKIFFLCLMEFSLFQFVPTASYPSLDTSEKGIVLSSLHYPVFNIWIRSYLSHLFSRITY